MNKRRDGNRKRRESTQKRTPKLGNYIIVTDTEETEKNYIYGLRDSLPQDVRGKVVIKVIKSNTYKLIETCTNLISLEPQYAQLWIIFDRDEVKNFDEIIYEAENRGIRVGWSNPCIEIWFDAYFGNMHNYDNSTACCHGFATTFERKTGIKYKKSDKRIYSILNKYGDEDKAISIAESRLEQHKKEGKTSPKNMCPCSTVQELVKEINSKI